MARTSPPKWWTCVVTSSSGERNWVDSAEAWHGDPSIEPPTRSVETFSALLPIFQQRMALAGAVNTKVVAAVSGGADSVLLARLLVAQCGGEGWSIAHFNHRLRDCAAVDAAFVEALAKGLDVPFDLGEWKTPPSRDSTGIENAARSARYRFLCECAERRGARFVLTGQHQNDQLETVLMHIARGAGLRGIAGMTEYRVLSSAVTLLRPMLKFTRAAVEKALKELKQPYCTDETNDDTRYTRNWVRWRLLPQLRARLGESFDADTLRLASHAAELLDETERQVNRHWNQIVLPTREPNVVRLVVSRLKRTPQPLVIELIRVVWRQQGWPMDGAASAHWRELGGAAFWPPDTRKCFPGGVLVQSTADWIEFRGTK